MNHTTTVEQLLKFLRQFDGGARVTFLVDDCQAVKVWETYGVEGNPMITLRTIIEKIEPKDHIEIWDGGPDVA